MPKEKKEKTKKTKSSGKGERFADMSATAIVIDETALEKGLKESIKAPPAGEAKEDKKPVKALKVRGKKYQEAKKKIDSKIKYDIKEAIKLLKQVSLAKFNGTVEAHLNVLEKGLGGETELPYFQAKAKKVVVFDDSIAENLKSGKIDFDVLLATAADMPKILPFAKLLGPKGLMPNPKNGTLVTDPKEALANFSGNALHYQTEKDSPIIHTVIGKLDQPDEELVANFQALIKAINPSKIKKAVLKSTMSPGIKVAL